MDTNFISKSPNFCVSKNCDALLKKVIVFGHSVFLSNTQVDMFIESDYYDGKYLVLINPIFDDEQIGEWVYLSIESNELKRKGNK